MSGGDKAGHGRRDHFLRQSSWHRTIPEVGRRGTEELRRLRRWLLGDDADPRAPRYSRVAPSIIARSEAELFGLCMPRFALRVYLDPHLRSFVNARRIGAFCDRARWWGKRTAPPKKQLRDIEEMRPFWRPAWWLRRHTCVADSLLEYTRDGRFHVLKARLGFAYGEEENTAGTPYVSHIPLSGGGLCAQAVCFMASALLSDDAKGVYGVADVTALAAGDDTRELLLTGLDQASMIRYFTHDRVGLRATWQLARRESEGAYHRPFCEALVAYVCSGMPVVLPLDSLRMAGVGSKDKPLKYADSIFARNGLSLWEHRKPYEQKPRRHAVLLVGTDGQETFLLNDPSRLPFMEADTYQLTAAASYKNEEMSELSSRCFMPVTPSAVRVPLEDAICYRGGASRSAGAKRSGLIYLSTNVLRGGELEWLPRKGRDRRFRLSRLCDVLSLDIMPSVLRRRLRLVVNRLQGQGKWPGSHWCWVEVDRDEYAVWLWDAEREPPRPAQAGRVAGRYLLCALGQHHGAWRETRLLRNPDPPEAPSEVLDPIPKTPNGLRASLISSFSVEGLESSTEHWPERDTKCDVYAFMQGDADRLLPTTWGLRKDWLWQLLAYAGPAYIKNLFRLFPLRTYRSGGKLRIRRCRAYRVAVSKPIITALDRMSALADDHAQIDQVADSIDTLLRERGQECVAISSFLPEIVAGDPVGGHGRRALLFLVRFARALRKRFGHRHLSTVELVAGSLIDGVWPGHSKSTGARQQGQEAAAPRDGGTSRESEKVFVANRLDRDEAFKRLLDALRGVAGKAGKAHIRLALELEPGPLYALDTWDALTHLCGMIAGDDLLAPVVGLNLDIAHWRLAGIPLDKLLGADGTCVLRRICHAHISDHGAGHFGDVELGLITPLRELQPWVEILEQRAAQNSRGAPPFSGFLSLELEACRSRGVVTRSRKRLSLLARGV